MLKQSNVIQTANTTILHHQKSATITTVQSHTANTMITWERTQL